MAEAGHHGLRPDRPRHPAGPARGAGRGASGAGIELISGAEISAEWGGQDDIHILALFVDENNAALQRGARRAPGGAADARGADGARSSSSTATPSISTRSGPTSATASGAGRTWRGRSSARATRRPTTRRFDRFLGREHPWYVPYEKWKAVEVVARDPRRRAASRRSRTRSGTRTRTRSSGRSPARGSTRSRSSIPTTDRTRSGASARSPRELGLAATAGSDFHGTPEGRKRPGGVFGDARMLDGARARRQAVRRSSSRAARTSSVRAPRVNGAAEKSRLRKRNIFRRRRRGLPRNAHAEIVEPIDSRETRTRIAANSAMLEDVTAEKTLPQNLEAERSVLGAILLDPAALALRRPDPRRATTSSRTRTAASTPRCCELSQRVGRDRRAHAEGGARPRGRDREGRRRGVPDVARSTACRTSATSSTTPGSSRRSRPCAG